MIVSVSWTPRAGGLDAVDLFAGRHVEIPHLAVANRIHHGQSIQK